MFRIIQIIWAWTTGAAPPPPPPEVVPGGGIPRGLSKVILSSNSAPVESAIFSLPSTRNEEITWQVDGTGVVQLLGSLNQTDFVVISTLTGPDITRILIGVTYLKAKLLSNTGLVTVTVKVGP